MQVCADLSADAVFGLLQAEARARHADLRGREVLLRLVDIERRDRAKLQLALRTLKKLSAQFEVVFLHLEVLAIGDHLPVEALGLRDDADHAL